jgi:hypothetical protein
MDLNRTPSEISSAAAEEIRALNHRTGNPKAFTEPADVANTASHLATLLERLPQALQQMDAGLTQLEQTTGIRMDTGTAPEEAVDLARSYLRAAREGLGGVLNDLRCASAELSHMSGPWPDSDDED